MGSLTLHTHHCATKRFSLYQKPRAARCAAIVRTAKDTAPGRTQRTQTATKEGQTVREMTNKDTQDTRGHMDTHEHKQGHKTRTKKDTLPKEKVTNQNAQKIMEGRTRTNKGTHG